MTKKRDMVAEANPDAKILDGLDAAIIGMTTKGMVVYSVQKIYTILISRDNMLPEEAYEWFSYNIECLGLGEFTPIFMEEL